MKTKLYEVKGTLPADALPYEESYQRGLEWYAVEHEYYGSTIVNPNTNTVRIVPFPSGGSVAYGPIAVQATAPIGMTRCKYCDSPNATARRACEGCGAPL